MKKKIIALVAAFMMIFSLAGCSQEGNSLLNELTLASNWNVTEAKGNTECTVKIAGEDVTVNADYVSYCNNQNLQAEMELRFKKLTVNNVEIDLTKGETEVAPAKFYMDGLKFYMSTSWIKDFGNVAGVDVASMLGDVDEYIAVDAEALLNEAGISKSELLKQTESAMDLYRDSSYNLPIVQDGRNYKINMTAPQMIEGLFALSKEVLASDYMSGTYAKLGLSDEEIAATVKEASAIYDQLEEQLKEIITDGSAYTEYTFTNDSYRESLNATLSGAYEDTEFTVAIKANEEANKASEKAIMYPANVNVVDLLDLVNSLAGETAPSVEEENPAVESDEETKAADTEAKAEVPETAATTETTATAEATTETK